MFGGERHVFDSQKSPTPAHIKRPDYVGTAEETRRALVLLSADADVLLSRSRSVCNYGVSRDQREVEEVEIKCVNSIIELLAKLCQRKASGLIFKVEGSRPPVPGPTAEGPGSYGRQRRNELVLLAAPERRGPGF
ncbi:hypothetical protein D4764_06G0000320 [Takifugu flavidus]|uniref:Uncharacterized protein n=1 Tax=Takifugu flavidus TaxID=433684 RepID=A0A5C6MTD9_9TELE|nr:hypothetical protein D4764_06G0000320 [Takifugu flavidus]